VGAGKLELELDPAAGKFFQCARELELEGLSKLLTFLKK
jgi:hypothetical protein